MSPPLERSNPYMGPRAFQENDAHLFFGRDREAESLASLVVSESLILFFAEAGTGKTSLIQARLVPDLRAEGFEVLPVARVGADPPVGGVPANIYTFSALQSLAGPEAESSRLLDLTLDAYLRTLPSQGGRKVRKVLILDQFEEILHAHPRYWEQREDLFLQIRQALEDDPMLSVLLVVREDQLAGLESYASLLPGRLRARFRMENLHWEDDANSAVRRPAEVGGHPFEAGVAEALIDNLRWVRDGDHKYKGEFVEPIQLQTVCFQLWENLRENLRQSSGKKITSQDLEDFGDVNRALERFYETALVEAASKANVDEAKIRRWCETKLITPTRFRSQVELTGELPQKAVDILVDTHLIRLQPARGGKWYELAHDRLIEPILSSNAKATPEERRQLTADAERWKRAGREPSYLYGGARLDRALKLGNEQGALSDVEQEFLAASQVLEAETARREAETAQEMARREAETARREAKLAWRLKLLVAALVPSLIVAVLLAWIAWRESRISASRALALNAIDNLQKDPELGLLLALEAVKPGLSPEAEMALHQALDESMVRLSWSEAIPFDSAGALAVSSDGSRLATVGLGGNVELRETESGRKTGSVAMGDPPSIVSSLAFRPKGDGLAIGDVDGRVLLADSRSSAHLKTLNAGATVNGLAFSPDGTRLAIATDEVIVGVWDVASGKRVLDLPGHTDLVWDVAFSKDKDGRYLATSGQDGLILVWDSKTGREIRRMTANKKAVTGVDFGPDGRLATSHQDSLARTWNLSTGTPQLLLGHRNWVWDSVFSRNGKYLATASFDGTVKLWNASSAQEFLTRWPGDDEAVRVAFDPRSEYLVSTGRTTSGEKKGWVRLWKGFLEDIPTLSIAAKPVSGLAFSPDGKQLVTADEEGRALLWDSSGHQIAKLADRGKPFTNLAFVGHTLAIAEPDQVQLVEMPARRRTGTLPGPVSALALSPDGLRVAIGDRNGTTKVWELPSRRFVRALSGPPTPILGIAFSPDGKWIATGGEDAQLVIWDSMTGRKVRTLIGHQGAITSIAFAPSTPYLATASTDKTARLWDLDTGQPLFELRGHTDTLADVAFTPDGERLATASKDGTVKVWNADTSRLLFTIREPIGRLSLLAFSPNGKRLAVASLDGTVRLEPLDVDSLIQLAHRRVSRLLTKQERRIYIRE